jgi:DAPG hydrolase PhiG domain
MNKHRLPVPARIERACAQGVVPSDFPGVSQAGHVVASAQVWEDAVRRDTQGRVLVTCVTDMPDLTPAMIDWWFGWHLTHSERYRLWHPLDHVGCTVHEDRSACLDHRLRYVGNVSHVDEYIGGRLMKLSIAFREPAEIGLGSADASLQTTVFATTSDRLLGGQGGHLVHHVIKQARGSQMRSAFWLGDIVHKHPWVQALASGVLNTRVARQVLVPDRMAVSLLRHCAEEMTHLANILPALYRQHLGSEASEPSSPPPAWFTAAFRAAR